MNPVPATFPLAATFLVLAGACADASELPPLSLARRAPCRAGTPGLVCTEGGMVRGRSAGGVTAYKGIPYAAPPVGALRWRPPRPASPWREVLQATDYGPACAQSPAAAEGTGVQGSEDCLTLNVWMPAASPGQDPRADRGRPVLFFIHGGYFARGSTSFRLNGMEAYDGSHLAKRAGAVVVTANYRLGPFGFVAHPALTAESDHGSSGNYGLLDQIAALRWVQQNIARFGGDPARVLLFGQSAGAISTAALYASPLARDLFARALLHSGNGSAHALADSERAGAMLAVRLGCDSDPDPAGCLRAKEPAEILAAVPPVFDGGFAFGPTVDGWVLPGRPIDLVRQGRGSRVPLILGVTANEFSTMVQDSPTERNLAITSAAEYRLHLRRLLGPGLAELVLARYPLADYESPLAALIAIRSDSSFVCPTRRFARAAATFAPVRRFVFSHTCESSLLARYGAGHGLDLPFVFGNFVFGPPSDRERALSETMVRYWARFATRGDPNGAGDPEWALTDPATDPYLSLQEPVIAGRAFRASQCDFWDAVQMAAGKD
jgi:para-nitrobenzyl esterase